MTRQVTYKDLTDVYESGFAIPPVMYGNGEIFKWAAAQRGEPDPKDSDGNSLLDNQVYELTSSGFTLIRVEDFE